jgi:TPR repeat protein
VQNTTHYLGLVALSLITGCAPSLLSPRSPGYDTQGCVEDSLRRSTHKGLVSQAASRFGPACADEDWAACSALGVISESGALGAPDDHEAARLYTMGCHGGNPRSCVNLGKLIERVSPAAADLALAQRLFTGACESGEEYGCAALGHTLMAGSPGMAQGAAESQQRALELLTGACEAGRSEACFDLGELKRRGGQPSNVARSYYAKSCAAGSSLGCQQLGSAPTVATR